MVEYGFLYSLTPLLTLEFTYKYNRRTISFQKIASTYQRTHHINQQTQRKREKSESIAKTTRQLKNQQTQ